MQKQNLFQRRILPALLALCMTLSLLPGTALAAQPVVEPAVYSSETAAPQAQTPATWRFLFVILKRNNITYRDPEGKTQKETTRMSAAEVNAIKFAAKDFKKYFEKEAGNLVKPVVDVIEIDTPITDLRPANGGVKDTSLQLSIGECYPLIRSKVDINKYDQIFAVADLNSIKTYYLGLTGGGFFQKTGYSFINTQNKDYSIKSFSSSSPFPSAVFVHEFLHTMEWWNENRTGKRPETDLHTKEPYGYGDYEFYARYINKSLLSGTGTKVGIDPAAWAATPYSVRSGVKTATVTFHANGGYRLPDSTRTKVVTNGKTYGPLPTPPNRPGYDFVGWFTSGDIQIRANDKVGLMGDHTLYAQWKPAAGSNIYTVTLDRVAGAIPTKADTKTVEYGKTYGNLPELKRNNYTFSGWYTARTGGKKVTADTKVTTKKDHTLYARWTKNASVAVTLNANNGSFPDKEKTKTVTVTKGSAYGTLTIPVRAGYTFTGWYTAKSGGKKITADTVVTASGKQTLYAHWVKGRTFQVVFNANGGEVMQEYKAVVHAGFYGALPTPVRNDYHFAGWWTKKTGGVRIRPETKVEITAKQTLYAHWNKDPVTVTERKTGSWTIRQPAGFNLTLYDSETTANPVSWYVASGNNLTLTSTRRVTLSNGVTRYHIIGSSGKDRWFTYSYEMDVK